MKILLALVVAAAAAGSVSAAGGPRRGEPRTFTVKADRIAVDPQTKAAVLTGHVEAVSEPVHLLANLASRAADGTMRLEAPTSVTTCTNHPGICHWALSGEVEYKDGKYVKGRNVWLEFYEFPVFWLPYFYYPLEGECGLRVMPGYMERWGAYLLTKYVYPIAGDPRHAEETFWLHGNTRFDLRYKNGVALGQTLYWNLGEFGRGKFKAYYAWDENTDEYDVGAYGSHQRRWSDWGSLVERDRYAFELSHNWDVTERDTFRLKGSLVSDSYFYDDFSRGGMFSIRNEWRGYSGNEIAWEHVENAVAAGLSVAGPLNRFYAGTGRLPEVYFDVHPTPVFSLPVNFESENRIGYLTRQDAEYGSGSRTNPYAHQPGVWANYEAFRFDSYNRFTAPFRTFDDFLSVVPRVGYHATGWSGAGRTSLTGWDDAGSAAPAFRSILESGVTFASRGQGWLNESLRHTVEPYFDVLAQRAWTAGMGGDARPYLFDSIDGSRAWEDQFAGRSRNLPYTYCGVTPGLRNALGLADEKGMLRQVLDFDVYAALQFNSARFTEGDDYHRLARVGRPNYGKDDMYVTPGARVRWTPDEDISLSGRMEYDPDYNTVALGDVVWRQKVCSDFSYFADYELRDHRYWDFSSTPYVPELMRNDDSNWPHFHYVKVGFTQQPISWFAWSPFVRWDIKENEYDSVGAWFDYLTDCLGFRLIVEYTNAYTRIDGYERDREFDVGFFIYLRALGADGANLFD